MEESKKINKASINKLLMFIRQIKEWFKSKPLFQKVLIIFAGISCLLVLYIISVLVRYGDVSDKTAVQGKVVDQNNQPIDGAVVASPNSIAVSIPDGKFEIQAKLSDTLTVSAYGYESIHVSASESSVVLSRLLPGTARLIIVNKDNKEVEDALVYRLDANTFAPVGIVLSDSSGSALFRNIPSGQVAFVVIHPDYGIGWVETKLSSGAYVRPIVRLEEYKAEKKTSGAWFQLVKKAYAQTPTDDYKMKIENQGKADLQKKYSGRDAPDYDLRYDLLYNMADTTKISDQAYRIDGETKTVVALGYDVDALRAEIEKVKTYPARGFYLDSEVQDRIRNIPVISSAIKTYRITQGPQSSVYKIEYGWDSTTGETTQAVHLIVETTKQATFVEIEKQTPVEHMAFLQQQHAVSVQDGQPMTVTSWSQADAAQLEGVKEVGLNQPSVKVCCGNEDVGVKDRGNNVFSSEVSSNDDPPSSLKITNSGNKTAYLNYSHRAVNEMTGGPNLENVAHGILEQNPTLSFVDKTSGSSFSFLEIPPPNPNDAPPAFLLDFFASPSDARSTYLDTPTYQMKWKQFMASIGSEVFQKEGRTPYQVYWDLKKDIGTSQAWREVEEKRLAQQSGSQGNSQQSQQSVPENTQDLNQQSPPITPKEQQDENPQVTVSETQAPAQNNQQQGNTSNSQGSGTGEPTTKSGGGYSGGGVVPR